MKLSYYMTVVALLAGIVSAQTTPRVMAKSELSAPVVLEGTQEANYLKVSLTGFEQPLQLRSRINLALVIDRSGSMSGDRIEKAREAAMLAIKMLSPDDIVSVIAYDGDAEVVIPATKATDKAQLINIIKGIQPGGSTAIFAGVSKGLHEVRKFIAKNQVNRVILLSDGQANVGPQSTSELGDLGRIAGKEGISVTTIGLGDGYNEDLMTALAGYSDGNHAFVANSADLEAAFTREFKDVMSVVAQEVTVTITLSEGVKPIRLLGRDGDIVGNTVVARMNQLYSNQEKYVLLEVIPPKGIHDQNKVLADIVVSYDNLNTKKQDVFKESIQIGYSKSPEVVQKAVVETVMVDSEIQKANLASEEAIRLIDAGQKDAALKVINSNVSRLKKTAQSVSEVYASKRANDSQSQLEALSQKIEQLDNANSRKMLKEESFKTKNQQK